MSMYSPLYNRLTGWLFFTLGIIGITLRHLGSYAQFSLNESLLLMGLGLLGMAAARSRTRNAVLSAGVIGILSLAWGVLGTMPTTSIWLGSTEPLETAFRFVLGLWGLYVATQDVILWRNT